MHSGSSFSIHSRGSIYAFKTQITFLILAWIPCSIMNDLHYTALFTQWFMNINTPIKVTLSYCSSVFREFYTHLSLEVAPFTQWTCKRDHFYLLCRSTVSHNAYNPQLDDEVVWYGKKEIQLSGVKQGEHHVTTTKSHTWVSLREST